MYEHAGYNTTAVVCGEDNAWLMEMQGCYIPMQPSRHECCFSVLTKQSAGTPKLAAPALAKQLTLPVSTYCISTS